MNKQAYRVIFSQVVGTFIAVAENVSSQGKSKSINTCSVPTSGAVTSKNRSLRFKLINVAVAVLFGSVTLAHAQMVAYKNGAGPRPIIDQSANGRPVVQIVTPNATGLSHNRYDQFNVDKNGVILNNSATVVPTQLGGYINGNPNIAPGAAAKIILNEVLSTNRSQLNGYIEVAGQRADVIVANPNGISVGGAGFINASRAVLTTGTPTFGGDGSLASFRVTQGDINVGSGGLNGTGTTLDLIARSVSVNDKIFADKLGAVVGANQVNYGDLGVTMITGVGGQPTVGIDSSALGGMYAQKIMLAGNEYGVGVRLLGDVAASAGDVTISNTGQITLNNKTNATGQIAINSASVVSNAGVLYAQQVTMNSGARVSNTGTMAAQNNLNINSASIHSTGVLAAGIDTNGQATQAGNLTLSASGLLTATGQNIAGGNIVMNAADIDLSNANTSATGSATLVATAGDIDNTGGNLQVAGSTIINATGAVINDGGVINTAQLTSNSGSLSNVAGRILQSGTANTNITTTGAINNTSGTIATNATNLNLQSGSLKNNSGFITQAGTGALNINTGELDNVAGSLATNGQLLITAATLQNQSGSIVTNRNAMLNLSGDLKNNQGTIQAANRIQISAANIDNSAGRLISLDSSGLSLDTSGLLTNAAGTTASGAVGGIIGGNGEVDITAANVTNSGNITAGTNLSANISNLLNNNGGRMAAANTFAVRAAALSNAQGVLDAARIQANIAQLNNNYGKISADQLNIVAVNLSNQHGQLAQFGTDASVIDVVGTLDNTSGLIQTNSTDLTLTPQQLINTGGQISHAGTGQLNINTGTGSIQNQNGTIGTNGSATVTAASINNQAGSLFTQGAASVNATAGDIDNSNGGYLSGDSLALNATGNINNAQGKIEALKTGLAINANSLNNTAGSIQNIGATAFNIHLQQGLSNAGGFMGSAGELNVNASDIDNSGGTFYAKTNLTLNANGTLTNTSGLIQSDGSINAIATGSVLNNSGRIEANGANATLNITGASINNTSGRIANSGTGTTTINGGSSITNNAGTIGGNGDVTLTANSLSNVQGQMIAGNDLQLAIANNINNAQGSLYAARNFHVNQAAASFNNNTGKVNAAGDINVILASLDNTNGQIANIANGQFSQRTNGGNIVVTTSGNMNNTAGSIGSSNNTTINANTILGNGNIIAGGDATIALQGDYVNLVGNTFSANNVLRFYTTGSLTNAGTLSAQNGLFLNAWNITNLVGALINSGQTVVMANNALTNQGRIYGDNLALSAATLLNDTNAVIAARNDLQIGANSITNQNHALITSLGNITIGGALDANYQATGLANVVTNSQATIDAGGSMMITANVLNNLNPTFATTPVVIATEQIKQYSIDGVHWYTPAEGAHLTNDGHYWTLRLPGGISSGAFWQKIFTQTTYQDQVTATDPGQIVANGNMLLNVGTVNNQASAIVAGLGLGGSGEYLHNTIQKGKTILRQVGIPNGSSVTEKPGMVFHDIDDECGNSNGCDRWSNFTAIDDRVAGPDIDLSIWPGDVPPNRIKNPALDNNAGDNVVPGGSESNLGNNQSGQNLTGDGKTVDLADGSGGGNTGVEGNNQTVATPGAALPNLRLPTNQLFVVQIAAGKPLIETDPAFTNYKTFISSDYMLSRLGVDPQQAQKRLGDGYYEQKLILDQITQLTGKRFLGNYATNEAQYEALMNNGVTFAQEFQLAPGIALTAAQMASLTSDMVWLVNQTVTLPDGSSQQVLVPVVYLASANSLDVRPSGAIISAGDMNLAYNNVQNSGTLQGNNSLIVNATNITNSGNMVASGKNGQLVLAAQNDINSSGTISGNRVGIVAGNDVNIASEVQRVTGITGDHTGITQVATINADQLSIQSGHDINLNAANIKTTGDAALVAGNNLNIGTVTTSDTMRIDLGSNGHNNNTQTTTIGSNINSAGNLTLAAGQDINATASTINADQALTAAAGRDINVLSGSQQSSHNIHTYMESSGLLSSGSTDIKDVGNSNQAIGSSLTGGSIALVSGRDTTIQGSQVIAQNDVAINAGRDLNIVTAQNTSQGSYAIEETKSGFSADLMNGISYGSSAQDQSQNDTRIQQIGSNISGANVRTVSGRDTTITASAITADNDVGIYAGRDINVMAATEQQTQTTDSHSSSTNFGIMNGMNAGRFNNFSQTDSAQNTSGTATSQSTSLISANGGNLNLQAGLDAQYNGTGTGNVTTQGAELLAKNQLNIAGNAVDMQAVQNASSSQSHSETNSITLGSSLTGAVGGAITSIGDMATEAQQTNNDRLKGALALKAGYDGYKLASKELATQTTDQALAANPQSSGGGLGVSVSLGVSQSEEDSRNSATQSRGTTAQAGEINITAREGDITMEGAKLQAQNIALDAAKNINLLAAKNTADLQSTNSGSSMSLGATLGSNGQQTGLSFQIGGSLSEGHANGSETTYDNTQITATNNLSIKSGGDTNLIGAQLAADKVKADIGGNLNIVTLQDQNNYESKQENGGIGVSVCVPPLCVGVSSVSVNYGLQTVDHNYQSAMGQSGIAAGSGGFDIRVKGNTNLEGAAITSTADASKNILQTASLTSSDLINTEHTKSENISISASTGGLASNVMSNTLGNLNGGTGLPEDSDQRSNTVSVISPSTVIITGTGDATKDAQSQANADTLTNRDASTANEALTNTLTLQQAQDLQAEQQRAMENQRAANLVGAVMTNMVGDIAQQAGWKDGSPQKIVMHGMVGLIEAKLGGNNAAAGLAAGMGVEAMSPILSDYLLNNGYSNDPNNKEAFKEYNDMMNLGSTLIGAAAGAAVGGSKQSAGAGGNIGLLLDTNNRQLHEDTNPEKDERKWAKENADKFAAYYQEKTGETVSTEQAEKILLGDGYRMVDAAANQGRGVIGSPMNDSVATQFISANAGDLFKATPAEYNSPFLNGNANGTLTPEQAALPGAVANPALGLGIAAGLVTAGTGTAAVIDAYTAYKAATAAYSMGAALGTGMAIGGASYTGSAALSAAYDQRFGTGQDFSTGFDQRFSYPGLAASMVVGGYTSAYSTAMFGWAGIPNALSNWATVSGAVIRTNSAVFGTFAGQTAQGAVNSHTKP
jgi:filamentous hemagglutinin